jgi:hypothetical protein
MSDFQMGFDDCPDCNLGMDGFLRTTGRHYPGFPLEFLCALIRLSYDELIPTYRCCLFQAHGLSACEVQVEIPSDRAAPHRGSVIGIDLDDGVEKMAHMALIAFCEHHLTDTAGTPLVHLLIQNQENPLWQQSHNTVCDMTNTQFSIPCSRLAKYTRYLFNLQHNTGRVVAQHHTCLNSYTEQATLTSHAMESLEHENADLCHGTREST